MKSEKFYHNKVIISYNGREKGMKRFWFGDRSIKRMNDEDEMEMKMKGWEDDKLKKVWVESKKKVQR